MKVEDSQKLVNQEKKTEGRPKEGKASLVHGWQSNKVHDAGGRNAKYN